jgi:hypothetical protein
MSDPRDDELNRELNALSRALDEFRVGAPPPALVDATLARAKRELHARIEARRVPAGYRRELARIAIAAAPPLLIVLAWNAFLLPRLADLLDRFLPAPLAAALAFAYAGGALLCLSLAAGSLPIAAHQRARLRAREA